jgi:ribonuclease BN (tRNA processing enzyme)
MMPHISRLALALFLAFAMGPFGPAVARAEPTAKAVGSSPIAASARTQIILLGTTGGPVANPLRSQPATAIVVDRRVYLFDLGNGVLRHLAKAGFTVKDVAGVFITHNHFDPNAALGAVMAFRWISGTDSPLPIVGPPGTKSIASAHFAAFRPSEEIFLAVVPGRPLPDLVTDFPIREGVAGPIYADDKIRVTAVQNSHYQMQFTDAVAHNRDLSISYRIETPDRVIVISGDTGRSDALEQFVRGADILVSEVLDVAAIKAYVGERARVENWPAAQLENTLRHHLQGHLAAEDLGRMAQAAKVGAIILTHFVPASRTTLDTSSVEQQVRATFSGPVVGGVDLDRF